MILKDRDDAQKDINALQKLLSDPGADARTRGNIEDQIRNITSGDRGEADAAYEMKVHYGRNPDWVVIHDLRIEHDGLVAQIDHLLINRLLDIWVCESKRFSGGIKINERGEFATFFDKVPRGVDSPIEQNKRHLKILREAFDAGLIVWPRRLGMTLRPNIRSLVLISRGAIQRPKSRIDGLETVIKTDQLHTTISRKVETRSLLDLVKLVSQPTLHGIGRQIADLHQPIAFNWRSRFGFGQAAAAVTAERHSDKVVPISIRTVISETKRRIEVGEEHLPRPASRLRCAMCNTAISAAVERYCRANSEKFDSRILCMICQKPATVPPPG